MANAVSSAQNAREGVGERVRYQASDGVSCDMRVLRAKVAHAPVLICLPAMGVRQQFYGRFARSLNARGFHVVTSDLRGIGTSSVRASRRCDFGYEEVLARDLPALLARVEQIFGSEAPRYLVGHSLGGQLSALYLGAHPNAAAGVVLIASCNVHYRGWSWPGNARLLAAATVFRLVGRVLGHVPAHKFGFAGEEARGVIRDWSNNCFTGTYAIKRAAYDYDAGLLNLPKPVLAISFAGDDFAPRPAVERLLRKMPSARLTHEHLGAGAAALPKAPHFDWAKRPDDVVSAIRAWVALQAPPAQD